MRRHLIATGLIAFTALFAPVAAHAYVVNDSGAFNMGLGYQSGFTSQETPTVNDPDTASNINLVPFTVGNFSITISAASTNFSSQGVHFFESGGARVLGDNDSGDGSDDTTAESLNTTVTITASYTGPALPAGFSADSFSLVIDQISIWALKHPGIGTSDQFFATETTAGNTGTSPAITLNQSVAFNTAAPYLKLAWNPGDFSVAGPTYTSTRAFTFNTGAGDDFLLDGLELIGSANLNYEIPEPASLGLLSLGVLAMLRRRAAR